MGKRFLFGNVNSEDYGVYISGSGTFNKPSRRVEKFSVPGRNGDLTIDEGCYNNVTVTYPCFIARGFENRFHDFMAAMLVQTGYQKLQDTYDEDHYRQALFIEEQEPEVLTLNRSGRFTLSFDCMPQRFLVDGDQLIDISVVAASDIWNRTKYIARPLLRLYGAGSIAFNNGNRGTRVDVSAHTYQYTDVDSDTEECYDEGQNLNQYVSVTSGFPLLYPSETTITVNGFSAVKIKPRWWEI